MNPKYLLIPLLGLFLFAGCKQDPIEKEEPEIEIPDEPKEDPVITKALFSGYVQKGPFINGSSVLIFELDNEFNQTGRTYSTNIISNTGAFEHKNIELVSPYVELKADGYYFNEVTGKTSENQLTLYAFTDVEDITSANINVLTHLEKARVSYLIEQGSDFTTAKRQAQLEVLAIFGFEPTERLPEAMNLIDDAALLAISCILQGYLDTGDMMELIANISADIKTTGKLNNVSLGSQLIDNAFVISPSEIRNNMENKYAEFGNEVTIPDFESYIQSFVASELYPLTVFINYPETGQYGVNILAEGVEKVSWVDHPSIPGTIWIEDLSLRAEVPVGLSLKIVIKDGMWYYQTHPNGPINWSCGIYNEKDKRQEFTVKEGGTPSDLHLKLHTGTVDENVEYITIEYYENDSMTPTKTKRVFIETYIKE